MGKFNYWTTGDTAMICTFYYCCSASTSATTRNKIFTVLQPKFNYLIDNAVNTSISGWSREDKEDVRQEVLIFFWHLLQNKLNPNKLQGILNFLWVCALQHIHLINRVRNQKKKPKIEYLSHYDLTKDMFDTYECTYDNIFLNFSTDSTNDTYDKLDLQYEIMQEIDNKIIQQEKLNRTNTIYLVLLKEYLIENNYDASGFRDHIKERLDINDKNFWQINHTLGIRSKIFNSDKNKSE